MQKRFKKFRRANRFMYPIWVIVTVIIAFMTYTQAGFVEGQVAEIKSELKISEEYRYAASKMIDSLNVQIRILNEAIEPDKNKMEQIQIGARLIRSANGKISTRKSVELAKIIYDACEYSSTIDYAYALSVISVESKFNPNAVSDAGAIGLGQLMPTTAAALAKQLGLNYENDLLLDPKYNVALSIRYMSNLRKDFTNMKYATAAYNGGPGGAMRYIDYANGKTSADSVHPETLAYVNSVMKLYASYASSLK